LLISEQIGSYFEAADAPLQEQNQQITLLQMFKGAFIIAGTSDGRVSIWTLDFEEAFNSGARKDACCDVTIHLF
jgi:hypothetical protein